MSEHIKNYVIPNERSNHNLDKKRHCSFRCDREPSRIPIQTEQQEQKGQIICLQMYVFEHITVFKNGVFFLTLENLNLSLNPLRHFVKVY